MAEGWIRHYAKAMGLELEVLSAGTEKTKVKPDAITVMHEVSIDLSTHSSKTLYELPDPWNFDVVITVCDSANEACPVYPVKTTRLHVAFPDPSGQALERWREVRDALGSMAHNLVQALKQNSIPTEDLLKAKPL
jgi:arsenate reductase (thioredoxin)